MMMAINDEEEDKVERTLKMIVMIIIVTRMI